MHTLPKKIIDEDFAFYKISFQWYPVIGVFAMYIPAIIISHLTGGQDFTKFNIKLLSPPIRKFVPKKYHHTELNTMENKNVDDSVLQTTKWIFQKDNSEEIEKQ